MKSDRMVTGALSLLVACCGIGVLGSAASACSIPVFRYALERWVPDPYEVVVLHRGPLSESDQALVERMRKATEDPKQPPNLFVVSVDLDTLDKSEETSEQAKAIAEKYADLKSPELLLHYPPYGPQRWLAWSGPLTEENVQRVIDSPLRRQIIERLLAGDSAVWVLIDSGDKQKDDEAAATIKRELARVEKLLKLPPRELIEAEQEFQPDTMVELRIGFSMVRLGRDDPAEEVFRSMLVHSEPELADFKEPIVVPIFGRGRTFFALVGKGINADNIEDDCRFICGDCSCQVKEQNPGMDMVFAANWDASILGSAFPEVELPELTGVGGLEIIDLETADPEESNPQAEPAPEASSATEMPATDSLETETRDAETPAAQTPAAETTDDVGEPAEPSLAMAEIPVNQNEPTAGDDETAAPTVAPVGGTLVEPSGDFGTRFLVWIVAGAAVAAVVIVGGSFWMRSGKEA